jgi:hypothetical protein
MMTFSTKKLNFGCERVKTGTVLDDFRTLQVEYGTVQDNDSTKSGEIFLTVHDELCNKLS